MNFNAFIDLNSVLQRKLIVDRIDIFLRDKMKYVRNVTEMCSK